MSTRVTNAAAWLLKKPNIKKYAEQQNALHIIYNIISCIQFGDIFITAVFLHFLSLLLFLAFQILYRFLELHMKIF